MRQDVREVRFSPRLRIASRLAVAIAVLLAWGGRAAWAAAPEAPAPLPAYELRLQADLAALAIAASVSSAWLLKGQLAGPVCAPVCDRSDLPAVDRFAAGNWDPTWRAVSDAGVATILVGSATVLFVDEGFGNGMNDLVVLAQAQLFSNAVAVLSNMGARRPRPFVYGDAAPLEDRMNGNASLSFFSGHTAGTVAVTLSTFLTLRRLQRPVLPWVYLGAGTALSALVGTSRVAAGDHFPTDVLVGAIAGLGNGALFPALHDSPVRVTPSVSSGGPERAYGLSFTGAF